MPNEIELPPSVTAIEYAGRDDWLAARMGSTGASSAAAMFDVGWQTPLQEYAIATGAMEPPAETEQMRMGHVMQPVARDLFEAETGHKTQDLGRFTILRNDKFPNMHATIDYAIIRDNGTRKALGVLECKNIGAFMVHDWDEGEIPLYAQIQVQQQLAITGWEIGAVAAILAGGRFVFDFVERNERFIRELASRVAAFWENVKHGNPPQPTADDGEVLQLLYPAHVPGKTVTLANDSLLLDSRLQVTKREVKRLKEAIRTDENCLKMQFGDAELAILPDGTRYSYKRQVRKAHQVDESQFPVLRRLKT